MSMEANIDNGVKRGSLIGCISLAILATTISLALSVLTGWQFGESLNQKLVMAAFGVLAVLGAHLLLALCRPASSGVRLAAIVLWFFCMAYVAYSHANFFLSSQQQAGIRRVTAIDQISSKAEPKRTLMAILSDQARIKTELAIKSQLSCEDGCFTLKVKVTRLKARLETLNAEADDVRRWQAQKDRQEAFEDAMRDDPMTTRLAKWSGVTVTQMGLITSLLFSLILEGVACLCWYVTRQFRDSSAAQPVRQLVTPVPDLARAGRAVDTRSLSELESKVEELVKEVKAGRLNLTVRDVRAFCECAQKEAAALRRLVEAKLSSEAQIC